MSTKLFNKDKTDYNTPSLFMGQPPGLFDSINKGFPKIFELFEQLKSQDWHHKREFDFKSCNADFKSCSKSVYEAMIMSLAWQWEADTLASRSVSSITAPFVTSDELAVAWARVTDNEYLHSLTYSEIVANSFDNPKEVLADVLKVKESLARLSTIEDVMEKTYITSHKLALGLIEKDQEAYNTIFMFVVALYALERIQFMSSFAVTFAIVETGLFMPIGAAVKKICLDEYEVHAELDRVILDYELNTGHGTTAFNQCKPLIQKLLDEVVQTEFNWIENLFKDGRELVGLTEEKLKQWTLFCAKPVYEFFKLDSPKSLPVKNPLGFMEHWIDINKMVAAPQEGKGGAYLIGGFENDMIDEVIDIDLG